MIGQNQIERLVIHIRQIVHKDELNKLSVKRIFQNYHRFLGIDGRTSI